MWSLKLCFMYVSGISVLRKLLPEEYIVLFELMQGLLSVKIDQKNEIVRISSCAGRDVTSNDLVNMLDSITSW